MNDTIKTRDLAKLFGISVRAVNDLAQRGVIARDGEGFGLTASVQRYCAHLRKLAMGRGGEEKAITSATMERGRLAREQADHIALKNAVARRELVSAAEVEAEWSGVLRTVRSGMLAVPSRCQQRLPGLTAHDVSEIDQEIRAVLGEIGGAN